MVFIYAGDYVYIDIYVDVYIYPNALFLEGDLFYLSSELYEFQSYIQQFILDASFYCAQSKQHLLGGRKVNRLFRRPE
ncbi:hypothetical protein QFZ80_006590 [Paenibacillus sp. V4I7]|nr:hypothetical protein [Paenibacillus sp. V4I7]